MTVYKIRVNYKSGHQEEAWFKDFKATLQGYTWVNYKGTRPLFLNKDEVESIWVIDEKEVSDAD